MANLIYFTPASLDSYIAAETGNLDLVGARRGGIRVHHRSRAPHQHVSLGTQDVRDDVGLGDAQRSFLAGRRTCWTSREADKIVYSKSRETVSTSKTRVEEESTRRWFAT